MTPRLNDDCIYRTRLNPNPVFAICANPCQFTQIRVPRPCPKCQCPCPKCQCPCPKCPCPKCQCPCPKCPCPKCQAPFGVGTFRGLSLPSPSRDLLIFQVSFLRNSRRSAAHTVARDIHSSRFSPVFAKAAKHSARSPRGFRGSQEWEFIVGRGRQWQRAQGRE